VPELVHVPLVAKQHKPLLTAMVGDPVGAVISPHLSEQHLPSAPPAMEPEVPGHVPGGSVPGALHSDGLVLGFELGFELGLRLGLELGLELGLPDGLELGLPDGLELGLELGLPDGLELGLELGEWELSTQVPTAFHALVQIPALRAGAYAAWLHHPGTLHLKA